MQARHSWLGVFAAIVGMTAGVSVTWASDLSHALEKSPVGLLSGAAGRLLVDDGPSTIIAELDFRRPLRAEERAELTRAGIRFYGATAATTYLAKVRANAREILEQFPLFRGLDPWEPHEKMSPDLRDGDVGSHATNDDGTWSVHVRFFEDVPLDQAVRTLAAHGIESGNPARYLFNQRLLVRLTEDQLWSLVEENVVRYVETIPRPSEVHNTTSQQVSNVDQIQINPYFLDGTGVVLGIWDGGDVLANHGDLSPRVTVSEPTSANDHATHVAGTILGSGAGNANAEGMAPNAGQLFSYDFDGGDAVTEQSDSVSNENIVAANHSWGMTIGWNLNNGMWTQTGGQGNFGAYTGLSQSWDELVRQTGLIAVKSSGNDRNDCNPNPPGDCDGATGADGQRYDLIGPRGGAKNVITVGAVQDNGTAIANFSSSGPIDDGRIKPDVVANGTGLTSTWAAGVTISNCPGAAYCSIGGTSMSTPTVTGIVADLIQHYRDQLGTDPGADVIKALLVNTADDQGRPGPDYLFGHGVADALAAIETIDAGGVRILTGSVDQDDTDEFLVEVNPNMAEFRLTLNWLDPEGAPNDPAADIVNDLDVVAVSPDGTTSFPFTGPQATFTGPATAVGPNSVDTVESIVVPSPGQGFWTVRVSGTSVPEGSQNYALVSNASFDLPEQPNIRVNAPLDYPEICPGQFEDATLSIFNTGGADLRVDSVLVTSGGTNFEIPSRPTQPFNVRPGAHIDLTVRFEPGSPGFKSGAIEIRSNDADEPVIEIPMTGSAGVGDVNATLEADGEFGDVALGGFRVLDLHVMNEGSCDLRVTDVMRTAGGPDFDLGNVSGEGLPEFPMTVRPGSHVDLPLRFEPSDFGQQNATFQVDTDDPDTPDFDVFVTGNSPPSDIRVTGSGDFGSVCAGIHEEREINVCNVGLSNLEVESVEFNPPCDDFEIVNNPFPATVSHDFCMPFTVAYTPTEAGSHSCTIEIRSNDPDSPVVTLDVVGHTPETSLGVPPDVGFPPTVIQSVDQCESLEPFPVSNTGRCPATVTDISLGGAAPTDYDMFGVPPFPIHLEPGHVAGSGDMSLVFIPEVLDRSRQAEVTVTWEADPITGEAASATRALCGEGVFTGARVLVRDGGVPLATVEQIRLLRINANRNRDQVDTVDTARNLPLVEETPPAPCAPFRYHREYGTTGNPIQLEPGSYEVVVTAKIDGKNVQKVVGFDVHACGFDPNVIVDF